MRPWCIQLLTISRILWCAAANEWTRVVWNVRCGVDWRWSASSKGCPTGTDVGFFGVFWRQSIFLRHSDSIFVDYAFLAHSRTKELCLLPSKTVVLRIMTPDDGRDTLVRRDWFQRSLLRKDGYRCASQLHCRRNLRLTLIRARIFHRFNFHRLLLSFDRLKFS
jgi:hypothetical protein